MNPSCLDIKQHRASAHIQTYIVQQNPGSVTSINTKALSTHAPRPSTVLHPREVEQHFGSARNPARVYRSLTYNNNNNNNNNNKENGAGERRPSPAFVAGPSGGPSRRCQAGLLCDSERTAKGSARQRKDSEGPAQGSERTVKGSAMQLKDSERTANGRERTVKGQ